MPIIEGNDLKELTYLDLLVIRDALKQYLSNEYMFDNYREAATTLYTLTLKAINA